MLVAPIVTIINVITLGCKSKTRILAMVFAHELGRIISTVGAHGRKLVRQIITIRISITRVVFMTADFYATIFTGELEIIGTVRAHRHKLIRMIVTCRDAITLVLFMKAEILAMGLTGELRRISGTVRAH